MPAKRRLLSALWALYCTLTTLQFIRFYSVSPIFYLNLQAYLAGHERMPFQERVLPLFLLRAMYHSSWLMHFAHTDGAFTRERGPFYLISLFAFAVAGYFTQKLYAAVTRTGTLSFLVYPLFLFAALWSYVIHTEANFSFPYDLLSVAFFAAGLYFIYTRHFWPLVPLLLLGTLNRETTLFLIGIYILDAASTGHAAPATLGQRFSLDEVPWLRVALLTVLWLSVKLAVYQAFAHNDPSENYVRVAENVGRLKPRLWPALLNICGYMLPMILIFHKRLQPTRFKNYLFILPLWFGIMFYTGVIVETRIYGELCPYVAVALVLILEHYVAHLPRLAVQPEQEAVSTNASQEEVAA